MKKLLLLSAFLISFQFSKAPHEGIQGEIFWVSGDQMPGPDKTRSAQSGVAREIQIYKSATLKDVEQDGIFYKSVNTELVATTWSKSDGTFKVKLPAGNYSIFTKEQKGLFANLIDDGGCVSCVIVNPKKFSWVSFTVDYEAAY